MNTHHDRRVFLEALLREVGMDLSHQLHATIHLKNNAFDNIVTDVDVAVQERLVSALSKRFPDTAFLNEEDDAHVMHDRMWIIDPIDGTKNFVRRQEDFAISVAYYEDRQPVFGMVLDVAKAVMYLGIEGQGAWANGVALVPLRYRPLHEVVLDVNLKTLDQLRLLYGADVFALSRSLFAHRSIGSGALSLCRLASGKHDVYVGDHLSIWDYAAGAILVRALGGVVTFPFADPQKPEPQPQLLMAAAHADQLNDLLAVLRITKP
jgi:myo-inositol-1(or 4)-monophosphatase